MNRRQLLQRTGLTALGLGLAPVTRGFPLGWAAAADAPKRRVLMYTKSEGYQHDVVKREGGQLSLAEQIVTDLGKKHNIDVTCTKDGRVFINEDLNQFDAFLFETQGDLFQEGKDKEPPMTPDGKKRFLAAVAAGKGFVGCHCASDTFHTPGDRNANQPQAKLDPYTAMIGGEFIRHGTQQEAWMRVVDHHFPGFKGLKDFKLKEEWYALKNFAPDLHVLLVQDTHGMKKDKGGDRVYDRPNFPATWARLHHKGRVFYTSLGHRDDVWKGETMQQILLGGLSWAVRNVDADVAPNLQEVAPKAYELASAK
jgi:type 1 glutamine amidotransferase